MVVVVVQPWPCCAEQHDGDGNHGRWLRCTTRCPMSSRVVHISAATCILSRKVSARSHISDQQRAGGRCRCPPISTRKRPTNDQSPYPRRPKFFTAHVAPACKQCLCQASAHLFHVCPETPAGRSLAGTCRELIWRSTNRLASDDGSARTSISNQGVNYPCLHRKLTNHRQQAIIGCLHTYVRGRHGVSWARMRWLVDRGDGGEGGGTRFRVL
ncbi:hypothetical protein BZA05DRAFT_19982 [Tricharina praecox]|uniref:uncharacterized protein n=1 Tax=Tricharina praecox TaxID=43433 RepID=UPI00221F96F4|nr:uncharacterized protein BZA05DRAFT_19982 [Tricharina praecox]KAI5859022.1 hypothetical protein BZA05DRAFT_19982 [Tricharina praecox]